MVGHVGEVELVDGVLDAVVPPSEVGEGGSFQLFLGEGALRRQHRHAEPKKGRIAILDGATPGERPGPEKALFDRLMETLELDIGGSAPACCAGASRLIDLQIGHRVLAQAVPVAIHEPGGADHGPGFVAGPKARNEAATELVAVLLDHADEFENYSVTGSVIGGLRARP